MSETQKEPAVSSAGASQLAPASVPPEQEIAELREKLADVEVKIRGAEEDAARYKGEMAADHEAAQKAKAEADEAKAEAEKEIGNAKAEVAELKEKLATAEEQVRKDAEAAVRKRAEDAAKKAKVEADEAKAKAEEAAQKAKENASQRDRKWPLVLELLFILFIGMMVGGWIVFFGRSCGQSGTTSVVAEMPDAVVADIVETPATSPAPSPVPAPSSEWRVDVAQFIRDCVAIGGTEAGCKARLEFMEKK